MTGSVSASFTLLFPSLSLLCFVSLTGLVFSLGLGVTGWNLMETVDCRFCAIQLAVQTYIASCLAPACCNQYNYTTTEPGHPAAPPLDPSGSAGLLISHNFKAIIVALHTNADDMSNVIIVKTPIAWLMPADFLFWERESIIATGQESLVIDSVCDGVSFPWMAGISSWRPDMPCFSHLH